MIKTWSIIFSVVFMAMYLILSYVTSDINPLEWAERVRALHIIISVVCPSLFIMLSRS